MPQLKNWQTTELYVDPSLPYAEQIELRADQKNLVPRETTERRGMLRRAATVTPATPIAHRLHGRYVYGPMDLDASARHLMGRAREAASRAAAIVKAARNTATPADAALSVLESQLYDLAIALHQQSELRRALSENTGNEARLRHALEEGEQVVADTVHDFERYEDTVRRAAGQPDAVPPPHARDALPSVLADAAASRDGLSNARALRALIAGTAGDTPPA